MALPPRIQKTPVARNAEKARAKIARTAPDHVRQVREIGICAATGIKSPTDAHHLMRAGTRGMGMKAEGRYTIPLCRSVHMEITRQGDPDAYLLEHYGLDARALADALWRNSGDRKLMERAVVRSLMGRKTKL